MSPGRRFVAGALMLAGIALRGVVTASLASWLLDKVREVEQQAEAATRCDVDALAAEVHALPGGIGGAFP